MTTKYTHRIRRCRGNKSAWCLVALDDDGSETNAWLAALTIDDLLRHSKGLLPSDDDVVQIIYYAPET